MDRQAWSRKHRGRNDPSPPPEPEPTVPPDKDATEDQHRLTGGLTPAQWHALAVERRFREKDPVRRRG